MSQTPTDLPDDTDAPSFAPSFASIAAAVDAICKTPPTATGPLRLPHRLLADEAEQKSTEELRAKIKALVSDKQLEQSAIDEMDAHMDPLTLIRFVQARPTLDAAVLVAMNQGLATIASR